MMEKKIEDMEDSDDTMTLRLEDSVDREEDEDETEKVTTEN